MTSESRMSLCLSLPPRTSSDTAAAALDLGWHRRQHPRRRFPARSSTGPQISVRGASRARRAGTRGAPLPALPALAATSPPPVMPAMPPPAEDAVQTTEVPIDVDAESTSAPDASDAEEDEEEEEDTHEDEGAAPALALRIARIEARLDPLEEVCRNMLCLLGARRPFRLHSRSR
jgi:hypothetical protein